MLHLYPGDERGGINGRYREGRVVNRPFCEILHIR